MKKIMILGAGAGQIPFINICKKKGGICNCYKSAGKVSRY